MPEFLLQGVQPPGLPASDHLGRAEFDGFEVVDDEDLRRIAKVEVGVCVQLSLHQGGVGTRFRDDCDSVASAIRLVDHLGDVLQTTLLQFALDLLAQFLWVAPRRQVGEGQSRSVFASCPCLLAGLDASTAADGPGPCLLVLAQTVIVYDVASGAERW